MATEANSNNQKTKAVKLPAYLKLAKGTMWFDTIGDNCSNVKLIKTTTKFIGRGYISDDQYQNYKEQGVIEVPEVPTDKFENKNSQHGAYGYIDEQEDKSYFKTSDIPNDKLGNIITAFKAGTLIAFDPKKQQEELKDLEQKKNFKFDKDGDIVFNGKNKAMYDKLNNSSHEELQKFISATKINGRNNLMDLYDYEINGYNRLNRPRATVLDAIRMKLNSFGPSMTSITVEENEDN